MKHEIVEEKNIPIKNIGRCSDFPPSAVAEKIKSVAIGNSFVTGKEWKARIYMACWKNRPLAVSISDIGDGNIRVWRKS